MYKLHHHEKVRHNLPAFAHTQKNVGALALCIKVLGTQLEILIGL